MSAFEDILNESDEPETTEPVVETPTAAADEPAVAESPAPEQTETSEPAPVAAEAQPITRDDGAVWSENAKRWYLNGKIVAGEPPAVTPSNPSAPQVQAPVVPETPAPVAPIGEPWTVRGGGGKHTIPGAFVTPEGDIVVKAEGQAQVKALIAAGIQHNTNYPKERQQWTQQIKQAEDRGKAHGQKYNQAAVLLWDHLTNQEWLAAAVQNPEHLELLRQKLDLTLQKASLAIPQQPVPQQEEVTPEVFGQALYSALDELIEDAPKGLLTADDIAELKQAYARRMNAYAAEHEGAIVLDFHAVRDDFARDLKMYQRAQQQSAHAVAAAQKAKAAAAFNAANKPPVAPTPTKPKVKPVPVGTAPSTQQRPGWDQSFKSAWSDDSDDMN